MEALFGLLIVWAISIPLCLRFSAKLKYNKTIAVLAGLFLPVLAPLVYGYLASNKK
jgi:hypothetical protein